MAINQQFDIDEEGNDIPDAQVEEGVVLPDDELAKYTDAGGGIWNDYLVDNRYEKDLHRYMMGMTSPNGFKNASVAFVQLAAPTLLWVADWTASRFGKRPIIPKSDPPTTDWVLLDEQVEPATITALPDGVSAVYTISGIYVYGHKNPNASIIEDVCFPLPPYLEDSFPEGRHMQSSDLQANILCPTESQSSE